MSSSIVSFPLKEFASSFCTNISSLIRYLEDYVLEGESKWNNLLPQKIYSEKSNLGYCIRTDILQTEDGQVRLSEMDFVAMGRFTIPLIHTGNREIYENYFKFWRDWYKAIIPEHIDTVYHAVTPNDPDDIQEGESFVNAFNEYYGNEMHFKLVVCNSAEKFQEMKQRFERGDNVWLDRSCYEYEVQKFGVDFQNCDSSLNHCHLDSKMVFALIHDPESEESLLKVLSKEQLNFWRGIFPKSYPLKAIDQDILEQVKNNKDKYVLKNAEVEHETAWGSQGVYLGIQHTNEEWLDLFVNPPKSLGNHPIVQEFQLSKNFKSLWNELLHEKKYLNISGGGNPVEGDYVFGRATLFFCIDPNGESNHSPYGYIDLRADAKAHYTKDCLETCFSLE